MQQDINNIGANAANSGNNAITLIGRISSECKFNHEVFGEGFYSFELEVSRLSDNTDTLPVTISERLFEKNQMIIGQFIRIDGQVRSYNSYVEEEGRNRLVLTAFVKDIQFIGTPEGDNPNDVYLNGYICKPPNYRVTPFGREIADVLLAINRSYNKSDYIPCIAWGRNSRFASKLNVGDNIRIWGRMQSRVYQKRVSEDETLEKTAYEVSISKIERAESEK
jgi:single-stranded DNA-binding protein